VNYLVGAAHFRIAGQLANVGNWRDEAVRRTDEMEALMVKPAPPFPANAMALNMLRQLADALFSVYSLLTWYFDETDEMAVAALTGATAAADMAEALQAALRLQSDAAQSGPSTSSPGGWPNPGRR